jgi:hypothetical protein
MIQRINLFVSCGGKSEVNHIRRSGDTYLLEFRHIFHQSGHIVMLVLFVHVFSFSFPLICVFIFVDFQKDQKANEYHMIVIQKGLVHDANGGMCIYYLKCR